MTVRKKVIKAYRIGNGGLWDIDLECGHFTTAYGRSGLSPATAICPCCSKQAERLKEQGKGAEKQ